MVIRLLGVNERIIRMDRDKDIPRLSWEKGRMKIPTHRSIYIKGEKITYNDYFTLDIDDTTSYFIKALEVKRYLRSNNILADVYVRLSAGGNGIHVFVGLKEYMTGNNKLRLRDILGDDCFRLQLDQDRADRQPVYSSGVLFDIKDKRFAGEWIKA